MYVTLNCTAKYEITVGREGEGGRMAAGSKEYRIMLLLTHDEKD